MGRAAGELSAETMLRLLDQRNRQEAMVGTINVAGAVIDRMGDDAVAHFVAGSVIKERGATERLAHAFQALVPDADRQRRLLGLAEEEVAASAPGGEGVRGAVGPSRRDADARTRTSSYVSEQYARELSGARTRAVGRRAHQRRSTGADRGLARHGGRRLAARASIINCSSIC